MKRMILIVDDEERICFVLRNALRKLDNDVEVETAGTAADALKKAETCAFDLIISDLIMPDMDGIELTEKLRDIQCDTPVVWMTAYGCRSFQEDAERLDVYCCVEKPLEIQYFRDLAQQAMAQETDDGGNPAGAGSAAPAAG